jgi:eukaryotic-like serine/threonine-protein kinase
MTSLPQNIGRYELLEFLGGGMSHVYRARDTTIGRTVALKILTPEGCADLETRERFLQEARMAGNVTHENIVNIYDYGEADGRPFLVMEFLQGEDLRSLIRNQQTGDSSLRLRIALQIARAIEYVHTQKIVHRDIKPDNIRIMATGTVKLMDFGIAKVEGLSRTQAGYVLGTPYYMAPEQVRGGEVTPLVDVYAFGILLFELFAGVKPVKAEEIVQVFHFILNEPIDFAPLRHSGTPEEVVHLIDRLTAKEPAQRPQSFTVIVREIEAMLRSREAAVFAVPPIAETKRPHKTIPQKQPANRRKWPIATSAIAGLLLIALAIFWTMRPAPIRHESSPPVVPIPVPAGMIRIPGGDFLSGPNREKRSLPAFLIDRREVSVQEYLTFARATGRTEPESIKKVDPFGPARDVTFDDAASYAQWADKRLPSSLEWERAARGTDGRRYPWGDQEDPSIARINVPREGPWPATYDADKSPDGVINMAGNVSEWVDEAQSPSAEAIKQFDGLEPPANPGERWFIMRGGSYMLPLRAAETWAYQSLPARLHSPALGFRCAKSWQ